MMLSIDPARAFRAAKDAHGDQMYGDRPYSFHLAMVAEEAERIMRDVPELRFHDRRIVECAAYLHDAIEDTDLTREEIEKFWSPEVAELVWAVTDGAGENRRERKAHVYEKIGHCGVVACVLKLADRIANVKECIRTKNESLLDMYRKEQDAFSAALDWRWTCLMPIWQRLEDLLEKEPIEGL